MRICDHCSDRGMCCRYIELPLARSLTRDEVNWVSLHPGGSVRNGSYRSDVGYTQTVRIEIACSALTAEGLCSLFGSPERPTMCADWPDRPEEQAPMGCAYLIPAEQLAVVGSGPVRAPVGV